MGDFNCCGGTKQRVLQDLIEGGDWEDIGTTQHTHEWGSHKCRIDRVLTRAGGRPFAIKEGWGCLSDHTAIGAKVSLKEEKKVTLTQTNWEKVREYIDREQELQKAGLGDTQHQYEYTGQAYEALRKLLREEWTGELRVHTRSKRWWKKEFKALRKKAAKDAEVKKEFRRKIKEAKKER